MFSGGYTSSFNQADFLRETSKNEKVISSRRHAQELNFEIERLLMINEALWTFIKEQHGYTDEDLSNRVEDIDLRDGKLDGKVAPEEAPDCPECKRKLYKSRPRCMYCGIVVERNLFQR